MRLQDKIVLITSAQNPCAPAIALGFAREGANFVVVDDDASQAEQLAAQVRALGRRALPLQCDVTQKSQVEEIVRRAVAEFGRIDVLLNCSGITLESNFLTLTDEVFNKCLDRGSKAYFLTCQAVGRQMAEQRSGKASQDQPGRPARMEDVEVMSAVIGKQSGHQRIRNRFKRAVGHRKNKCAPKKIIIDRGLCHFRAGGEGD